MPSSPLPPQASGDVAQAAPASLQALPAEQALLETLQIATAINGARHLPDLLQEILSKSRLLTGCDAGSIFLIEPAGEGREQTLRFAAFQNGSLEVPGQLDDDYGEEQPGEEQPGEEQPGQKQPGQKQPGGERGESQVPDLPLPVSQDSLVGWTALSGEVLQLADAYAIPPDRPYRFNRDVDRRLGYRSVSMLVLPLRTSTGVTVGVLQLINCLRDPQARLTAATAADLVRDFSPYERQQAEALASLAAVCVERTRLLAAQQRQIDSMIALLAGAIDARSPHTGLHCSRVPRLAEMIAAAAEQEQEGPLAPFRFAAESDWREFRTAAWLHDCGKISTPEAVVEKATKLQTSHDRIHEIRTRFEVLHRDSRIRALEEQLAGGEPQRLEQEHRQRLQELQDDFRFVAQCNLGSEHLADASIERLHQIGGRTWQRHFDDRLGLGWEERALRGEETESLPSAEPLLADKPHHRIPRPAADIPGPEWRFRLQAPEHLYDRGELHNLSVRRGTLTEEEMYKIREHMIHTIMMLETMEFPAELSRVAAYAGGHHETLDGKGYPRGLTADELSIPARILAIADIFEALTASDRPYKEGKTLSQSLAILAAMRDQGRIDPDLFALFVRAGIPRRYGETFLRPTQLDDIDVEALLRRA